MAELVFDCISVEPDRYAAAPTLVAKVRIAEITGVPIHCVLLRCQIRIEPQRRAYTEVEKTRLYDLFGHPQQWGEALRPMQFANLAVMVPGFTGATTAEVPIPVTYDLEVGFGRYFHALDTGDVPLLFLFSGTVFQKAQAGFAVEQVPWDKETTFRMPAETWRRLMEAHFPGEGWLRLPHGTIDELRRFKSERGLPTWDMTIEALLKEAGR